MVSNIRLLRPLACLGLVLSLAACTTANPTLPTSTASIPVPETAPRTTALTVTGAPVQMAYAGPAANPAALATANAAAHAARPRQLKLPHRQRQKPTAHGSTI